jgi:alanyl-tRNA synthetase
VQNIEKEVKFIGNTSFTILQFEDFQPSDIQKGLLQLKRNIDLIIAICKNNTILVISTNSKLDATQFVSHLKTHLNGKGGGNRGVAQILLTKKMSADEMLFFVKNWLEKDLDVNLPYMIV